MPLPYKPSKQCFIVLFTTVFAVGFHCKLFSQKDYTTISKNINPDASDLYHDLSPQGDSLYLKSEGSIFYKVAFLNSLDRKVFTFNPPLLETRIPLHDIIVGDYTVLVYEQNKIIVFHISRLLEIDTPEEPILFATNLPQATIIEKVKFAETPVVEVKRTDIQFNEILDSSSAELKLAMHSNDLSLNGSALFNEPRAYNLSDMNREGMQTREDYRRNSLRPNGRPYN